MNYSTLEPNPYTTPLYDNASFSEWKGQRSSKFPPTIHHSPAKDLIKTSKYAINETSKCQTKHQLEEEVISLNLPASKNQFDHQSIKLPQLSIGILDRVR